SPCLSWGTGALQGKSSRSPSPNVLRQLVLLTQTVLEPLRLVNGPSRCAGRVEVLHNQQWGTVCDDNWDLNEARVVCWQLGCGTALSAPRGSQFGQGTDRIWLDEVNCTEIEAWEVLHSPASLLIRCTGTCLSVYSLGVFADSGISEVTQLRLVNGPSRCAGRVEVLHNQQWGTVCDDSWDITDARVMCRQLGCGTALSAPGAAHFGPGSDHIWLDTVNCTGTEAALSQCRAKPWGDSNCTHEDAAVCCSSHGVSTDPISPTHRCAGRVKVLHNQQWETVCDDSWDITDAGVVCRQLGCGTALSAPGGARFGRGSDRIWLDDVHCTGTEAALTECRALSWGDNNCNHREDAGVVCSGNLQLPPGPAPGFWPPQAAKTKKKKKKKKAAIAQFIPRPSERPPAGPNPCPTGHSQQSQICCSQRTGPPSDQFHLPSLPQSTHSPKSLHSHTKDK
uniref:Soluble scavenger receptor cysteine-rich domain-containing protein SSC5D n=1 Tax=Terrapene triunguis TaxID=2587831 RepID=A0A674JZE8_9SAUR